MPRESNEAIVFIVPGDSLGAGATRGGGAADAALVPGLEGEIRASVRVAQRRDGGADHRLAATPGEDVVVLQIDGGPQLVLHPENARDLLRAQSEQLRGGAGGASAGELRVPAELRWSGLEQAATSARGASRGFLGKVALKLFQIIRPKAAKLVGHKLVQKIDGQVSEGVYALRREDLKPLAGEAPVAEKGIMAERGRALVLIHGTFSNTAGTFAKLWSHHPGQVGALFDYYDDHVYALDHATLGRSPIENALTLAKACPDNTRLSLLTHSRGGLVAEVLVRAAGMKALDADDLALFEADELPQVDRDALDSNGRKAMAAALDAQRKALGELVELLAERNIVVERVVRVACPARGTLLAGKRFDAYLSVLRWAMDLAQLPVLQTLTEFLGDIARQRSDPSRMPGLAAMVPDSPLVKWLHAAEQPAAGRLWVIAGDMEGESIGSWLKTLMADAFFWTDNDLVVQTRSMYGGTPRADGARFQLDQRGKVSHFRYFTNKETAEPIVDALTVEAGAGWRPIGPLSYAGESSSGERAARGDAASDGLSKPDRPAVFVLPGILGSHIKRDGKRIWLGFRLLGGLDKLAYSPAEPPQRFAPDGVIGRVYDDLIKFLARSHEVVEFSYDWRKPIEHEAKRLGKAVDAALDARSGSGQPVRIVAHSMGGLVSRAMQLECPDVWERMMTRPGGRLLMLGTPNGGSWAPMQTLTGDDSFGNTLVAFGAPFQDHAARQMMAQFPGFIQLQTALTGGEHVLGLETTWQRLASDDLKAIREYNFWHQDERQLSIYRWGVPAQAVLDQAIALRKRLDEQRDKALPRYPGRLLLVIGRADFTPDGFEFGNEGLSYRNAREAGDGRVTRDSAMLPGVPTWQVDCEHGSLPDHGDSFEAYLELLEHGTAKGLDRVVAEAPDGVRPAPVVERSRPSRERLAATPPVQPYRLRLLDVVAPPVDQAAGPSRLKVRVVNGDLAFVRVPLLLGHYSSSSLSGAEYAVDRLIGGTMAQSLSLGQYPDQPGTHQIFANTSANRENPLQAPMPERVVVVGLGEESTLAASSLMLSVRLAVLALAQRLMEEGRDTPSFEVAATLLGSGGANVTAGQAAQFIARGVRHADVALARLNEDLDGDRPWPRVTGLQLIEQYLNRATEAWQALDELATTAPRHFDLQRQIQDGNRARRRPLDFGYRGASYDIIRANRRAGPASSAVIEYAVHTRRARAEVRAQITQAALVGELVKAAASGGATDDQLGCTLFQLLVPVELEPTMGGTSQMLLELDNETAAIPWELLDTPAGGEGGDKRPWAIRTKMVRKLRMEDYRATVRDARVDAHVLVIGEPKCDQSRYPRLPGARSEAHRVVEQLTQGPVRLSSGSVVARICGEGENDTGHDARELINTLMDSGRSWRIVHIAGHGEPPESADEARRQCPCEGDWAPNPRGVVLSGGSYLGPAEIRALRVVPELVFVNCCHLATLGSERKLQQQHGALPNPAAFASGVAAELIRIGVRCVVAAGWAVDDDAAESFAVTFYQALMSRRRFMDAVALARDAAKACGGNTWAAYQCYGDPDWVFRRPDAGRDRPRVAPRDEFGGIGSAEDLVLALDAVAVDCGVPEADMRGQRARIRYLAENFATFLDDSGRVAEAFGRAWAAAGDGGQAIACYRKAIAANDGSATIKAGEQLCNQLVRQAWGRVSQAARDLHAAEARRDEFRDGGVPPELLRRIEAAAGEHAKAIAGARKEIGEAIEKLAKIQAIQPNMERLSLLGSAKKREAMLLRAAGDTPEKLKEAIEGMQQFYARAETAGVGADDNYYPALNRIAADLALAGVERRRATLEPRRIEAIRQALDAKVRDDPDFWSLAGRIELRGYEALAGESLGAALPALLAEYDDLAARVSGRWQWASVRDQLEFVLHQLPGVEESAEERKAAEELLAAIRRHAGETA
ncbi:MAG: CHAT domain-containing protein [Rhodocyclaceae bacterium]|nr:CHAT domain-containing protein [Rhodocyclaceae bacterium]